MSNKPHTILITRPLEAGLKLCQSIEALNKKTIHFPTIDYIAPNDLAITYDLIKSINQFEIVIFVSPKAVLETYAILEKLKIQLPKDVMYFAVGGETAKLLQPHVLVSYPEQAWHSEGLLALPMLNEVRGKNIAIVSGKGGRTFLKDTLRARGAKVTKISTYERRLASSDPVQILYELNNQTIDVIIGTSFEAVKNLKTLLINHWKFVANIPLLVSSERIKTLAEDLGYKRIWVSPNASKDAILETLQSMHL